MNYDTKYCFIESNGKNYQLNLTLPFPSAVYAIDQILANTRFLMPLGAAVSTALFVLGGCTSSALLEFIIGFVGTTGLFYFPKASFSTGLSALLRNNKLKKTINNFYKKMYKFELAKLSLKLSDRKCREKQQKIANEMVKLFAKFQKVNLRQAVKYEKKLRIKRDLSTTQGFAYGQLESSIITIDKFIFHNFSLLKDLCPEYEEFISERVNNYLSIISSGRYLTDEIIKIGLKKNFRFETITNDDIFKRESSYPTDLCRKLGFDVPEQEETQAPTVSQLPEENRGLTLYRDGRRVLSSDDVIYSENENEF